MGKSDDFAARFARIKEQTNAPDPTGGTTTDPRQSRVAPPRPASPTEVIGLVLKPKLLIGTMAALALAAFVLSPQSNEKQAAAKVLDETNTEHSLFKATPNSRVIYSGEGADVALSHDDNSYAQRVRANVTGHRTETDQRLALLASSGLTDKSGISEMPKDIQQFFNKDGSLTELTQELITDVESE